jgi:hypothetical protein
MSAIFEAITGMIEVIADNPSSILIALGFIAIIAALFVPLGAGLQLILGGLGALMIIGGIGLNLLWLDSGR